MSERKSLLKTESKESILKFLGLAARAGKVISGFDAVISGVRNGEVKLLIITTDISGNTLSKLLDEGERPGTDLPDAYSFGTASEIGGAIGRPDRVIVGITDEGFSSRLSEMLDGFDEEFAADDGRCIGQ